MLTAMLTGASAATAAECDPVAGVDTLQSDGWGFGPRNTRFQPRSVIDRGNVNRLGMKWVFALDDNPAPHSYPLVTEDTVFVGTANGNLYALDSEDGCVRWQFDAGANIRTAVIHGRPTGGQAVLFVGTQEGLVHAVDAASGRMLWTSDASDYPFSMVTGTPLYRDGRLYVPVSSGELGLAVNPFYGCCRFRGSVVAMDATNGSILWRTHTIRETPQVSGRHFLFVEEWGPSGAPVWSAPAYDPDGHLLYIGTGENYSRPASDTSDSIIALDAGDGAIRWVRQFTGDDAFNMACVVSQAHPNCPDDAGPDLDFGAPPIVSRTPDGQSILLAGQKSGGVYAMDPTTGERIWSTVIGRGGYLGGIHWGMAVNESLGILYVPVSDIRSGPARPGEPQPGLHALDIASGAIRWSQPEPDRCDGRTGCRTGLSAAIVATDALVFAGGLDGHVQAFDAATGDVLWSFDTWRPYRATTETETHGGTIDVHGPMVARDLLLVTSGYGTFGATGGNALIAFQLDATDYEDAGKPAGKTARPLPNSRPLPTALGQQPAPNSDPSPVDAPANRR